MQVHELREMGEALTRARELCHEAQYERGLAVYENTLQTLRQWIRHITKMAERQPWLQMQIDLENEFNLISDYAELTQAFKIPLGAGRVTGAVATKPSVPSQQGPAPVHPRSAAPSHFHQDDPTPSPRWEIRTPESKGRDQNPVEDQGRDPDVWASPSPDQFGRGRGGGQAPLQRAPPSWASDNANNGNRRVVKPGANKPGNGRAAPVSDRPSGRRTPSEDQQRKPRPAAVNNEPSRRPGAAAAKSAPGKDGGLKVARRENAEKVKLGNGTEKPKYSEIAREEGMVDLELIEMIERDIVDSAPKITFDHIAGLEHTKQLLQEAVMLPQIAPHLFKDGRLKPCNGVLMFGPPGTGKTLLAKAVANVCNTTFFNISASTLASKYRGESEKMVRILFDMARYYAPSIIFMDEIDSIAGARGGAQEHESSRRVKTELLVQINGVGSGDPADPNNRVMVLAATNLPWELDEAMRRRLTKRVYIPLPGAEGRRQLFKLNLERVDVAPDVNFEKLIAETEGYSGDDICGLCETAKMMPVKRLYTPEVLKELHRKKQEGATEDELKTHEKSALEITWADFQTALENVSKSVGQDQLERFVKWEEEFGSK
uniref:Katanin p60 ATPase-containing subunit A1 n=1 Tax=Globisporangium ultimum (strain ATCC 200006 / CBS 805.95 / DAOM BR144) TaxID=431595 RepID=K3WYK6_GLOUD